jgi:hypothetical protein
MIRDVVMAFDDWLSPDGSFTSDRLAGRLGRFETMAVQATYDTLRGTATGDVGVEVLHSANGREWLSKAVVIGPDTIDPAGGSAASFYGYTDGAGLLLVRLKITCTIPAHARVYVILRDPSD